MRRKKSSGVTAAAAAAAALVLLALLAACPSRSVHALAPPPKIQLFGQDIRLWGPPPPAAAAAAADAASEQDQDPAASARASQEEEPAAVERSSNEARKQASLRSVVDGDQSPNVHTQWRIGGHDIDPGKWGRPASDCKLRDTLHCTGVVARCYDSCNPDDKKTGWQVKCGLCFGNDFFRCCPCLKKAKSELVCP